LDGSMVFFALLELRNLLWVDTIF